MSQLSSSFSKFKTLVLIQLDVNDFTVDNSAYAFLKALQNLGDQNKLIIDISQNEVILSEDIRHIEELITVLTLQGIDSIVCGFSPFSASMVFDFIDNVRFKTSLNVDMAYDEITY